MAEDNFDELEAELSREIIFLLADKMEDLTSKLADVQPPTSVMELAANAAASVLVAFERGYRMSAVEVDHGR